MDVRPLPTPPLSHLRIVRQRRRVRIEDPHKDTSDLQLALEARVGPGGECGDITAARLKG